MLWKLQVFSYCIGYAGLSITDEIAKECVVDNKGMFTVKDGDSQYDSTRCFYKINGVVILITTVFI